MTMLTQALKMATQQVMNVAANAVEVVFVTKGTYVPGQATTNTESKITGRGAWLDVQDGWSDSTYSGTLIVKGDKHLYLEPSASFPREPKVDTDFVIDAQGVKWKIVGKRDNDPSAGDPICYFLLMRK